MADEEIFEPSTDDIMSAFNEVPDAIYSGSIIGVSEAMRRVMRLISKIAATESTVLITGESGTGKELIASAIHYQSPRASGPFIPINAGALPDNLLESELFGHVRGAFTGADRDKKGLFEEADGGTIFLDEVGELPAHAQVKLLRVLQDREVRPVGSNRPIHVDVRVIAATNRDLKEAMEAGTFREDLFYRLNVLRIHIPPLRDRRDDIPILCRYYIEHFNERLGKHVRELSPRAQLALMHYDYPGNVRELQNAMERAVALADGDVVSDLDLPPEILERSVPRLAHTPDDVYPDSLSLREVEDRHIRRALARFGGNATRAASSLGISRATLWRKLKRMDSASD